MWTIAKYFNCEKDNSSISKICQQVNGKAWELTVTNWRQSKIVFGKGNSECGDSEDPQRYLKDEN